MNGLQFALQTIHSLWEEKKHPCYLWINSIYPYDTLRQTNESAHSGKNAGICGYLTLDFITDC